MSALIEKFKILRSVKITYKELEEKIHQCGLLDYVVESIQGISARVGSHTEERSFEGLALEALFGEQLRDAGVNTLHNSSPKIFWYDYEFPDDGMYMDVKKHTSNPTQVKWLSIFNSTLNPGNQLFHLRNNGELDKLYIFFVNVRMIEEIEDDVIVEISPSWIVKADKFFENLLVSKSPNMSYFNHHACTLNKDYIKFNF